MTPLLICFVECVIVLAEDHRSKPCYLWLRSSCWMLEMSARPNRKLALQSPVIMLKCLEIC